MPNMYASAVCSGKVTPGGKKNKAKKAMGGSANPRQMYRGGGMCKKGRGRAYGQNS